MDLRGLPLHSSLFVVGLLAAFLLGKAASLRRPLSMAASAAATLWLAAIVLLLRRPDLAARPVERIPWIGDQVLLMEVWIAWPALLLLASLSNWLPRDRDRKAVRAFTLLIATTAGATAVSLAAWPYGELGRLWRDGICLQTADYTCGAASAVNFLDRLGLRGAERGMARGGGGPPGRG